MNETVFYRREVIGNCVVITPECWITPTFTERERVFHPKFGHGTVTAVGERLITADFDKVGEKRVVPKFLQPLASASPADAASLLTTWR